MAGSCPAASGAGAVASPLEELSSHYPRLYRRQNSASRASVEQRMGFGEPIEGILGCKYLPRITLMYI